ncbi:hypothetical protein OYC64_008393 [Pagothenia borchgrevinki]|uniref:THAP domain-containing protein 1 n=1 Tax=Pagothenia borchgrevinki TaxID=8213 RepID=A0ABD2G598_PAGBO
MPGICCAVGCDNSRQRNPGLQFVSIPKDVDRRNKWLAAIRRDHWQPTSNSRLCSQHFVSGRKNDNPMSPDYIPSLFALEMANPDPYTDSGSSESVIEEIRIIRVI